MIKTIFTLALIMTWIQNGLALDSTSESGNTRGAQSYDVCYHGSPSDPFQHVVAYVYLNESCPTPLEAHRASDISDSDHEEDDEKCRVTRIHNRNTGK